MIKEKLKYGHSVRIDFEQFAKVEETNKEIINVEKDLVLNYYNPKSKFINLIIKPNVNVNITQKFEGEANCAFEVKVVVGENSKVNFFVNQNLSSTSSLIHNNYFSVKKNAKLNLLNLIFGSKQLKHKTIVSLDEEGAECNNNVAYISKENQKFVIETSNIHNSPRTNSYMLTKGVLDDNSKVVNTGVVRIESHAFNSNGYQKGNHLLLSNTAEVNPIPELEINNHDVKCSHGVTISKISNEKMFYFTSRGIPKITAKKMFIQGFISPALKQLSPKEKEKILEKLR